MGQAASPETIRLPAAQTQTQVTRTRRGTGIPIVLTRREITLLKKAMSPEHLKTSLGSQAGSQAGFRDPCDTRQGLDSDSAPTGEVRKLGLLTYETGTPPSLTPMSPSKHLTRGLCAWLFWGHPS